MKNAVKRVKRYVITLDKIQMVIRFKNAMKKHGRNVVMFVPQHIIKNVIQNGMKNVIPNVDIGILMLMIGDII